MGLLDFQLPGMDTAEGQGLLAASLSLMGATKMPGQKGAFGQALAGAGQQYMQTRGNAQEQLHNREVKRLQLDALKRAAEQESQMRDAARGAFRSPEMANAMSQGPMPDGGAMPQAQPGFDSQKYAQSLYGIDPLKAMDFERSMQKENPLITVAEGGSLYDRQTGKAVFTSPKETKFPSSVQEFNFGKSNPEFNDWLLRGKQAGAPTTTISMTDGQKGFDNERNLSKDFSTEPIYKTHQEVQSAFSQVTAALDAETPVGDLAGATKIMKILDPGSVVRESELGMAMAAGGRMDRLQNYLKQSMDGTKLTPQQRTDFKNLSTELTAASAQAYNSKRKEYLERGNAYGLNTDRALGKEVSVPTIMRTPTKTDGLSVTAPNGKIYTFKSEQEMKNFKMAAGLK